jgi:hypothetical protein
MYTHEQKEQLKEAKEKKRIPQETAQMVKRLSRQQKGKQQHFSLFRFCVCQLRLFKRIRIRNMPKYAQVL